MTLAPRLIAATLAAVLFGRGGDVEQDGTGCVPESVCAALWQIGVRGVCRYADFTSSPDHPQGVLFSRVRPLQCLGWDRRQPVRRRFSGPLLRRVYEVSDADAPVAHRYGQYLPKTPCLELSTMLPGGFLCYDAQGKLVSSP